MKKYCFILLVALLPVCISAQIPNNGFETWTTIGSYSNPNQWATLNDVTASANVFTCTKGTPGNPGSSYIKLTSKSVTGMGLKPGIAVSGALNSATMQAVSGFPFTGRPESLAGNWEYMAYGSDKGYISILLTKWNATAHSRDTIGYKFFAMSGMVMNWAAFTIPMAYQSSSFPDSAIIVLSASNANGAATAANSFLYIDNLTFKNIAWLSAGAIPRQSFHIFPNPVINSLTVEIPGTDETAWVEIFNLSGKLEFSDHKVLNSGMMQLDVHGLLPGTYIIKLKKGTEVISARFIRN